MHHTATTSGTAMVSRKTLDKVLLEGSAHRHIYAQAKAEVEALGWISYDTATAIREAGGDPVRVEESLLNSVF